MAEPAYLTFDDGPDSRSTATVLEALDEADAGATFFVIGTRAAAEPGLIEAMLAPGHRVELHCHEHRSHEQMDRAEIRRDAERGLQALERLGVRPTRWRPPYGGVTEDSYAVAAELGLELTAWTANPRDWAGTGAAQMLAAIDPMLGAHTVVILHDGIRDKEGMRAVAAETIALVGPLVAKLRARGCEPVPLPAASPAGTDPAPLVAAAGFAPAPWSRPFAEFHVLEEDGVDAGLRLRIGEFIADLYEAGGAPYRGRGWRTIPPTARIVAFAGTELIGQVSLFLPRTEPECRIGGIGDLAVARGWRRRGVARTLLRQVAFQGWRRGAVGQLSATEAVRSTLIELGFSPVEGFTFYWEDHDGCHRHPRWVAAAAEPLPRPLKLLDPDF